MYRDYQRGDLYCMNDILVSVIMPSLNVCKYIELSLKSVINQTLKKIEIICIDAGSTDGTLDVIKKYMEEDKRIKLINSPVKSYGYQINYAIKVAKGEYIAIVETDDYINSNMYQELYDVANKTLADIVKCNYLAFWTQKNGEKVFLKRENLENKDLYNTVIKPIEEPQTASNDWYLWTGIYRKSMIIENDIKLSETKGAAFQDIGFLHRSNVASKGSVYVNKAFYNYRLDREDSSSNSGKGIEYSFYEYKRLLSENWEKEELIALFGRMATFFKGCINGIEEKDLNNKKTRVQFDWFRDKLSNAIDEGIINETNINSVVWRCINPLPISIDEVYEKKIGKTKSLINILASSEQYEIIIFGCGNFGYYAKNCLTQNGYTIKAYSDNNEDLWGTYIENIPVISPQDIDLSDGKTKIVIANERYFEDIKLQLLSLNFPEELIAIY